MKFFGSSPLASLIVLLGASSAFGAVIYDRASSASKFDFNPEEIRRRYLLVLCSAEAGLRKRQVPDGQGRYDHDYPSWQRSGQPNHLRLPR